MLGSFSGGGLGMGIAFSLYDDFSATANSIEASMGRLGVASEELSTMVNASINQMFLGAGLVAAGFLALVPVGFGLKWAAQFEQARAGLQTFLGSAKAAQDAFSNIKEDVLHSATYTIEPLLKANMALISTGLTAARARRDTNALANAVAAVGRGAPELERISLHLQQFASGATKMGMMAREFGFVGINIFDLLSRSTGKTVEELHKMPITYDMITTALVKANSAGGVFFGASERLARTMNGVLSNLKHEWQFFLAGLGDAVFPMAKGLLSWLQVVVKKMAEFTATPFGQTVTRWFTALALLAIGFGAVLLVSGLLRFSIYKLAGAFGKATKAEILQTIAQQGVVAGFREMAVAAWASLGPYVLIAAAVAGVIYAFYRLHEMLGSSSIQMRNWAYVILFMMGPIGWLIGGIMAISQGLKDFDGFMEGTTRKLGGIMGFFQKLGGVIRGVVEIFQTYDAKTNTFTLHDKLAESLDKLGVLQFVINLGTYISRFMELIKGFKEVVVEAFGYFKQAIIDVMNFLSPGEAKLNNWNDVIQKCTSNMETWHKVGRALGWAFVVILGEIVIIMTAMAAAALVVAVAMAIAFAVPLAIMYGIYKIINWVIDKFHEFKSEGQSTFEAVINTWLDLLIEFIEFIPNLLLKAGEYVVRGMLDGIKNHWHEIVEFIQTSLMGIGNWIGKGLGFGHLGDSLFGDGPEAGKSSGGSAQDNKYNPFATGSRSEKSDISKATPQGQNIIPYLPNSPTIHNGPQQAVIPIFLDGKNIGEYVIDFLEGKAHRK